MAWCQAGHEGNNDDDNIYNDDDDDFRRHRSEAKGDNKRTTSNHIQLHLTVLCTKAKTPRG